MGLKSPKYYYFYQGSSSKPSPDSKREKMEFFIFLRNAPFLDRFDENAPKWPPKIPEMALIC